ncbi:hypothetical protein [Halobacillus sp. A5]|uniref:hypothetical protein n=1 Tax=Halobacillus sp. A5 TaxID=2880263 RepID=UPI0020A697C4|nr:hypothetical protein [Halobacillus sp. A5]MCP3026015.1 hypothetical protein [Halobacillus sp. A5]
MKEVKNEVRVRDGYVEIKLEGKHGKDEEGLPRITKVDAEDYIRLKLWKYRWLFTGCRGGYAVARDSKNKKIIRLHRLILGLTDDDQRWGDHISREYLGLDNRKKNLRAVNPDENCYNRQRNKGQKYKGVSIKYGKYRAQTRVDRKKEHFGLWENEELAAYAYDCAVKKVYGEFAHLNSIDNLLTNEEKKRIEEYVSAKLGRIYETENERVERIDLTNKFTDKQQDDSDIEDMK